MMDRKVLGRGISALIPEKPIEKEEKIVYVAIEQIKPNQFQPRENFNTESMGDLIQSIKEKGVIQPVLARQKGDYYELIAGERRFRAAVALNLKEIPVIIKDVDDRDSLELALIENIQRQELNPIEEARAFQYLIDKFEVTHEKISEVLGKARVSITNTLRLLKLPLEIQNDMKEGRISFAHGRALLELEDINQQRRLASDIISKSLSVRELESLIKTNRPRLKGIKKMRAQEPYVSVIQEELQQSLATKVNINKKKKRGEIVIEFYSDEDLRRIVRKLKGES